MQTEEGFWDKLIVYSYVFVSDVENILIRVQLLQSWILSSTKFHGKPVCLWVELKTKVNAFFFYSLA